MNVETEDNRNKQKENNKTYISQYCFRFAIYFSSLTLEFSSIPVEYAKLTRHFSYLTHFPNTNRIHSGRSIKKGYAPKTATVT
jgi:hypothetical protein